MNYQDTKAWLMQSVGPFLHYPAVLVLGGAIAFAGWVYFAPKPEKAGEVVIATVAKEVRHVPKVDTPIKSGKVAVYAGGAKLKKKLNLPQPVVDAPEQSVLAASKIPAGERSHAVTTVLNTDTGASETYVRTDPLPWLAYENRGAVGAYTGVKNGKRLTRLQATQDFVQIKALHVGVVGAVDYGAGKPDIFVGVGVAYRW